MADLPITRTGTSPISRIMREFDPFERMRELMGFDPFEQMGRMLAGREPGSYAFVPAFEVKETPDAFVFKADVPGVQERDLDITLTGDRLTISGRREVEKRNENERYYTYECSYGAFSRSFTLPEGVDADRIDANLQSGVLTVRLPKAPEVQPKRIQLQGGRQVQGGQQAQAGQQGQAGQQMQQPGKKP